MKQFVIYGFWGGGSILLMLWIKLLGNCNKPLGFRVLSELMIMVWCQQHEMEKINIARSFSTPVQKFGSLRRADSGNICLIMVRPAPLTLMPNSSDNTTMASELCSSTTQTHTEKGGTIFENSSPFCQSCQWGLQQGASVNWRVFFPLV